MCIDYLWCLAVGSPCHILVSLLHSVCTTWLYGCITRGEDLPFGSFRTSTKTVVFCKPQVVLLARAVSIHSGEGCPKVQVVGAAQSDDLSAVLAPLTTSSSQDTETLCRVSVVHG